MSKRPWPDDRMLTATELIDWCRTGMTADVEPYIAWLLEAASHLQYLRQPNRTVEETAHLLAFAACPSFPGSDPEPCRHCRDAAHRLAPLVIALLHSNTDNQVRAAWATTAASGGGV